MKQVESSLRRQAAAISLAIKPDLTSGRFGEADSLLKQIGSASQIRYTLVLKNGQVAADSHFDPAFLGNYIDLPEVPLALNGEASSGFRMSLQLGKEILYLATPLREKGRVASVLLLSLPKSEITDEMQPGFFSIGLASLMSLILIALAGYWAVRRLASPLNELEAAAKRFAGGDLSYRLTLSARETEAGLVDALNQMAGQLGKRIEEITRQRNELETVLANMVEGVIVLDNQEKILRMNEEAERIFGVGRKHAEGRGIIELLRNTGIERLIREIRENEKPVRLELTHHEGEQETFLAGRGSILQETNGKRSGILLVFNNITQLRKLENMRREFVANVSHELKTPLTSIKGFVETLRDGAVDEPERARQFLDIVHRQVERLAEIVNNLLMLSRIEQEMEGGQLPLEERKLRPVMEAAVSTCREKAGEKGISIKLNCPDSIILKLSPVLLEEAVVNLIDNAINYSESGSEVIVDVAELGEDVRITVQDFGSGIAAEHLPRLFERFYRGDKARSRKMGGTGLGLAIVKHIVQAHGGRVTAESIEGQGSTFYIFLKRN